MTRERATALLRLGGLAALAALAACGSEGRHWSPDYPLQVAWTVARLPTPVVTPDSNTAVANVSVTITVAGLAHHLGTALGDSVSGADGPAACAVIAVSGAESALTCAAGLAYTRFVATLAGGQLVVVRHEGVDTGEDAPEDHVKGEVMRLPAAGKWLSVSPYAPTP